jgi:hypothetical protein
VQEFVAHLLDARFRMVHLVFFREVGLLEAEAVLALVVAVGPPVGSPAQPRRLDRAPGRIEIQIRVSLELLLDQPLDGKAGLVGVRLGIAGHGALGPAAPRPARQVDQLDVGEAPRQELHDFADLCLQVLGVPGETADVLRRRVGFLDPDHLDLLGRQAGLLQAVVHLGPVLDGAALIALAEDLLAVLVLRDRGRHAADGAVDEHHLRIEVPVAHGNALKPAEALLRVAEADPQQADLAVGRRFAIAVQRPDLLGQAEAGGFMGCRPLVRIARIQSALEALVLVRSGHVGQRHEPGDVRFGRRLIGPSPRRLHGRAGEEETAEKEARKLSRHGVGSF